MEQKIDEKAEKEMNHQKTTGKTIEKKTEEKNEKAIEEKHDDTFVEKKKSLGSITTSLHGEKTSNGTGQVLDEENAEKSDATGSGGQQSTKPRKTHLPRLTRLHPKQPAKQRGNNEPQASTSYQEFPTISWTASVDLKPSSESSASSSATDVQSWQTKEMTAGSTMNDRVKELERALKESINHCMETCHKEMRKFRLMCHRDPIQNNVPGAVRYQRFDDKNRQKLVHQREKLVRISEDSNDFPHTMAHGNSSKSSNKFPNLGQRNSSKSSNNFPNTMTQGDSSESSNNFPNTMTQEDIDRISRKFNKIKPLFTYNMETTLCKHMDGKEHMTCAQAHPELIPADFVTFRPPPDHPMYQYNLDPKTVLERVTGMKFREQKQEENPGPPDPPARYSRKRNPYSK